MDFIHKVLNIALPPIGLITLLFSPPSFLFFKSLLSILRSLLSKDVAGKVVLIPGASSGIGEHLAYQYARRGACLVLVARREKSLQEVADRTHSLGSPEVLVICADVSKVEDCKRFVDDAVEHFGRCSNERHPCRVSRKVCKCNCRQRLPWGKIPNRAIMDQDNTFYWKAFCPQILEWCSSLLLITKPGTSKREAPSKKILDLTGAEKFLYPPSIQSPELKVD